MKRILCVLAVLAMLMTVVPVFAFGAEAITLEKTPVGNTGAVITVSGGSGTVTAASSDTNTATVSVSGTTVTVTGVSGAVGIVEVTVTRGGQSAFVEVPVGYTTFSFSGRSVTVYAGSCNKYEILGIEQASETEYNGSEGTGELSVTQDAEGNSVYTAASGYELSLNIKKAGGDFVVNGSSEYADIMVKKEATGDAYLYLDGLNIKSQFTAALTVKKNSTKIVYVTALAGSVNTFADSALNNADAYGPTDEGGDGTNQYYAESAVIKGKTAANVVIGGTGVININAAAKNGVKVGADGILTVAGSVLNVAAPNSGLSCENELRITGGTVGITSTGDAIKAADDTDEIGRIVITGGAVTVNSGDEGILARENVSISGGTLSVTAAGDGVKAENGGETSGDIDISGGNITLRTTGDGISAFNVVISGGVFDIVCANGYTNTSYNGDNPNTPSAKCIKAEVDETISGGTFTLSAPDDTLHSDGNLTVEGGTFDIWTRDDGVHSELVTTIGIRTASDDLIDMNIHACYEGIEGADVVLNSGRCTVYASDDVVNAANGDLPNYNYTINVWGGVWRLYTSGGDGVDSNSGLFFRGGDLEVYSTSNTSNDPLDSDGMLALYDGTVLACGQNAMQGAPSAGIYVQFTNCSIRTGYSLVIKDGSGNILKSTTAWFASSSNTANYVVFSHPDMTAGQTYYLYINGSTSAKTGTAQGNHVDSTQWTDLDEGDTNVFERVTAMNAGSRFVITNASASSPVYTLGGTTSPASVQSTLTSVSGGFSFGTLNENNTYYIDAQGRLYNTVGGTNYYLAYTTTGGWNPTYNLTKTTDASAAATWQVGASGSAAIIYASVSGGPGGPGGGGPGGQQRRLYLYCTSGQWRLASSTSASGYTVYIYAPAVEQAALTGTLYYAAQASDNFSIADVQAGTVIKYRSGRTAAAQTLEWTNSHISWEWEPEFVSSANGTYILTVMYDGVAFGTVTVVISGGSDVPPEPVVTMGDVNGDGTVDVSDALLVLRFAMGIIDELPVPAAADVDASGGADLGDALLILRAAMGLMEL